jgi:hypothetical protein
VEGYSPRIDRILTEHKPFLPDVDGSRLAIERNYNNQNLESALEVLTNARTKNIQTLRAADETQLDREAMLEGVGSITLRTLVQMMSEHDEDHINDLRTIRRRLNS